MQQRKPPLPGRPISVRENYKKTLWGQQPHWIPVSFYDATYFTGGWMNSNWYDNSPVHFLQNMPMNHHYIDLYNQRSLIFCVGQGAWEADCIRTLLMMASIFKTKGIKAWCDFWGYDVSHDWDWWKKQLRYFLPKVLDRSAFANN
jgi:esterase/lipase superfamily enzyme